ncbi:MAG: type II secretion system protein GspE [Deltaproteobacteria bacterium]|nr:type II secretion system protein GspE [Deltaproteobacteria bacterium]
MATPLSLQSWDAIEPFSQVSVRFLKENRCLPLKREDGRIVVAMADVKDQETLQALEVALGAPLIPLPASEEEIMAVIQSVYEPGSPMARLVGDLEVEDLDLIREETAEIGHLRDMAREAPIIQLVNLLVLRAIDLGASDIHLEPFEDTFEVRYRKDGILFRAEAPPKGLQAAVISRLKIMSRLDIAERRLPQDGRFRLKVGGRDIDFRVSTLPTLLGESMVIRILDREKVILELDRLGFPARELKQFDGLIHKPHGMILVTGPTGSGKTTTLYAALERINSVEKKIITIEDPVEYRLLGVTQMQVKPTIGLTFARGLRHIVRQDPDVVLVGEIRDGETAEIAIHAALTGHLVFSTLHTNDAAGAVTRLLEMGVEDYLMASALIGVLAQRLVRLICPSCREEAPREALEIEARELPAGPLPGKLYQGRGCPDCAHTGYQGRTGIYELLLVDETLRRLILERADAVALRQAARRQGMVTLAEDGWAKVARGLTTVQEVLRVTQE